MASRPESVPASCGVSLEPTSGFLPPDSLDYVVVIGGIGSVTRFLVDRAVARRVGRRVQEPPYTQR